MDKKKKKNTRKDADAFQHFHNTFLLVAQYSPPPPPHHSRICKKKNFSVQCIGFDVLYWFALNMASIERSYLLIRIPDNGFISI